MFTKENKKYEKPCYTSDVVVFAIPNDEKAVKSSLKILLIQRRENSSSGTPNVEGGKWALPGGHVDFGERGIEAATRELEEETGIVGVKPIHFGVYDAPGRDPRGWYVTNAFYTIVEEQQLDKRKAGDDAKKVELFRVEEALELELAFDHREIITDALKAIKKVRVSE